MAHTDEQTAKRHYLAEYLREKVDTGAQYFKSKKIASELGLTSKEVGSNMPIVNEEVDDLDIECWNSGAKEATWFVKPTRR